MSIVSYQKNGDPSQANVVKGYGPAERVDLSGRALRVVLVPVDAVCLVMEPLLQAGVALSPVLVDEVGQRAAFVHPGVALRRADEFFLRRRILVVHRV